LSEAEKYQITASHYAAWHLDFVRSWQHYERRLAMDYNAVVNDTVDVVEAICQFFHLPKSREEIQIAIHSVDRLDNKAKNFNVGRKDRGQKQLPASVIQFVDEFQTTG
jgi:hypothetical protein